MTGELGTCLWFNDNAKDAAEFYRTVFSSSYDSISESSMAVHYSLFGRKIMHLNGGPHFKINPAISLYVELSDNIKLQEIWDKLVDGGKISIDINSSNEKYGWCEDKYGVNWHLVKSHDENQNVTPHLMFTGPNFGKAKEAMHFYTSMFNRSKIISEYDEIDANVSRRTKFSKFELNGSLFNVMDSNEQHDFNFNEAVSIMIHVDTQEEIDYYWEVFERDGGKPGRCGWIKDKYGVSWQVIPSILGKLMSNPDTAQKTSSAFLRMNKFIISDLVNATT